jgi:hypothetical protein
VLEARQLADDERKYAEDQAEKYQTSLEESGIQRGYFFKKALKWKFGGEFKAKKQAQLQTWKSRADLFKSAATGKSGKNNLNKFERSQAIFDMFKASDKPKTFRDKFKPLYEGFVDDPMTRPQSHWVKPGTAKKIQKATSRSQRVSKEDILNSLSAITDSIERVAESISEKNKIIADQMIHSSVLQGMMHQQLKTSNDSLENKLQKIVDVLSNQTQYQKQSVDKIEAKSAENKLEAQKDAASIVNFDDLTTKEDESKVPERPMGGYPSISEMGHGGMDLSHLIPKAEQGGIFSGPDSGYLAELHGNEMVVPLDNNYTQGEPSAVDGKVRPKPQQPIATPKNIGSTPKYEMGTNTTVNSAPITSKFGFNTTQNIVGNAGGGTTEGSKLTQSMVDVMSLPMMAAGGTLLSATTKYMQSLGGEGANINPEIERVSRPIANVFGLPPTLVSAAKGSTPRKAVGGEEEKEDGESKKDLFAKLTDGFGELLKKLGDSINKTPPPPPPGPGSGAGITTTGEKGVLDLIASVEQGPEGYDSFNQSGGKTEGKATDKTIGWLSANAQGAIGRYQQMPQFLLERAKRAGFNENTKFTPEVQDAITLNELRTSHGLDDFLSGKITEEQFLQKISGTWRGLPQGQTNAAKLGGSVDMTYQDRYAGRNAAHKTYSTAISELTKIRAGNTPVATPSTQSPTAQLGQAITNNYGLKVGQERAFTVPGYGEVKAHKTAVGFDFYDGGTKLDMSKAQGKAIVQYFTSTNGGQQISPPQAGQQISSLSTSSSKSSGGGITVLNTGGGQQIASAGSSPQPSADGGVESGRNPTQDFFSNSFSLGVG